MDSPLSFHCVICCEPFDNTHNYPVVLPCGHTYICSLCANRLERCFECRTSLFLPEEVQPQVHHQLQQQQQQSRYRHGRASCASFSSSGRSVPARSYVYRAPQSPQAVRAVASADSILGTPDKQNRKKERQRLPSPKNLVLLSLMEVVSTSCQNEKKARKLLISMNHGSPTDYQKQDKGESFDEEINNNMIASMVSTTCGTYIVSSKDKAPVFEYHSAKDTMEKSNIKSKVKPSRSAQEARKIFEEVDINLEFTGPNSSGLKSAQHSGNITNNIPIDTLFYGDKLQVVTITDGWAILSRSNGIVSAEKLAKIGPPVDEACRLEGILVSLSNRKEHLAKQENEIKQISSDLIKDLKEALKNDDVTIERAPVIIRKPEPEEDFKVIDETSSLHSQTHSQSEVASTDSIKTHAGVAAGTTLDTPLENININIVDNDISVYSSSSNTERSTLEKKYHSTNFRTGLSGHKALAHYTNSRNPIGKNGRTNMMSSHSGLSIAKSAFRSFYGTDKRDTENSPAQAKSSRY